MKSEGRSETCWDLACEQERGIGESIKLRHTSSIYTSTVLYVLGIGADESSLHPEKSGVLSLELHENEGAAGKDATARVVRWRFGNSVSHVREYPEQVDEPITLIAAAFSVDA